MEHLRKTKVLFLISLLTILGIGGCYEEAIIVNDPLADGILRIISFDQIDGIVDKENKTILFTLPSDTISSFAPEVVYYGYGSMRMEETTLENGVVTELGMVTINHPYRIEAKNGDQVDTFNLFFTTLPLIHIVTDHEIPDEPKVLSRMILQYCKPKAFTPAVHTFETFAGIEIRGGSSMRYGKKSFGLELWENKSGMEYSASVLGMRFHEDWILDAMYIDPLRMRNKISFELWEKMAQAPPEDQKDHVFPGINCEIVELFINNRYHGIYNLNEKLDAKLLQYSAHQHELGGVLYKAIDWAEGSTSFETYNSEPPDAYIWDGWEQVYPKHFYSWDALAELRKLIVTEEDSVFKSRITSLIDPENYLDYYLFINLLKAYDNAGKNTFLAKYTDQSKFFIIPWDIEASWGIWWNGTKTDSEKVVENQLFKRLRETNTDDFEKRVALKWIQYRNTIFSLDSLMTPINRYYDAMILSGALERENNRWEDISIDPYQEYEFIHDWLKARLKYLDEKFDD